MYNYFIFPKHNERENEEEDKEKQELPMAAMLV